MGFNKSGFNKKISPMAKMSKLVKMKEKSWEWWVLGKRNISKKYSEQNTMYD